MAGKVDGKVAFITGVARGQGRSHAVTLAREGADIIGIDFLEQASHSAVPAATQEDLDETIRQVEALDRRIIATKSDVRDYAAVKAAVDDGVAELGRLDIVSANAGIVNRATPTIDFDEDVWNDNIDTNLNGVWRTVKAAVPHIRHGGQGGAIVITSSVAGIQAYPGLGSYAASKRGAVGLMQALALELAPDFIRVNSIHPTQVDTPMIQNQGTMDLFAGRENASREEYIEVSRGMNAIPVPWVDPADISNALLFLVSDDARYITGAALPVDAGNLLM